MLKQLPNLNSFLCLSSELVLSLLQLQEERVHVFYELKLFRPVYDIVMHEDCFMIVFTSGDSEIFTIKRDYTIQSTQFASFRVETQIIHRVLSAKVSEHEK
jgi:hypothetical protein